MPRPPRRPSTMVTSKTCPKPSARELNPQRNKITDASHPLNHSSAPLLHTLPLPNTLISGTQQADAKSPLPASSHLVEPKFLYATERTDIHYTQIQMPTDKHKIKILLARIHDMFPRQIKNASIQISFYFLENMHFLHNLQNNPTFIQDVLTKPFEKDSSHIMLLNNIHNVFERVYANQQEINSYLLKAEPTSFFTRSINPIVNLYGLAAQNIKIMLESINNGQVKNYEELKKNMDNIFCLFDNINKITEQISYFNFQHKNSAIHDNEVEISAMGIKYPEELTEGLILDNMYDLLYRNEDANKCVKIIELTIYIDKILHMELSSCINLIKQLSFDNNTFPHLDYMIFFQKTMQNRLNSVFDMIQDLRKNHLENETEESISILLKIKQEKAETIKSHMDSLISMHHKTTPSRETVNGIIYSADKLYNNYKEARNLSYKTIEAYLFYYPKLEERQIFSCLQNKGYISDESLIELLQNPNTRSNHELYHSAIDNICKEMGVNLQDIYNNND